MSGKTQELGDTGYNIEVTGRHIAVTDAMKSYAEDKVRKIEHFTDRVLEVQVTMDIQKLDHVVDIVMKVGHYRIKVQAVSPDMYASIDKATDRLCAKLRRYQSRLKEHHAKPISAVDMTVNVYAVPLEEEINDEIEDENRRQLEEAYQPHTVKKVEKRPLKQLTLEEAILKMELSGDSFLLFRAEDDQRLKVIYRRDDGNYGVLEPE